MDSDSNRRQQLRGQVLADFITDFTPRATELCDLTKGWILNMDRASNSKEADIEIVLIAPEGSIIKQSFTFGFPTSNNEAEYEAVLTGLRMAIILRVIGFEV